MLSKSPQSHRTRATGTVYHYAGGTDHFLQGRGGYLGQIMALFSLFKHFGVKHCSK